MNIGRRLQAQQRESGIPVLPEADAMVVAVQPLLGLAMIILSVVTVDPLGWSGRGLFGSCLLIANGALTLTRTLPDTLIGPRLRWAIALVWSVPAGLLFAFDPGSFAVSFAFMLAIHAGIRFPPVPAVVIGSIAGITAMTSMAIDGDTYWWIGVFIIVSVTLGMLRRNRMQTLQAAHELVEQTRRTAASEAKAQALAERARIARDIHDVLAHSLSGVNMQLSMADALFEAGRDEQGRDAVRRAQHMVVEGLGEARRAVQALREDVVDAVSAIRAMLSADHEQLVVSGEPGQLDVTRSQTLLRTAQEALTNARRHAPGAPVLVTLRFAADQVRLEVTNGGVDAPPTSHGSGMGLIGMRERAALIGATVTAGPVTHGEFAGGWQVQLVMPVGVDISGSDEEK
jgi:signal transduction histidine kinase